MDGQSGVTKKSNSQKKMDVLVTKTSWNNGKKWVKVNFKYSRTFFPSFEDMHRIIQAICFCEDEKYPTGEGRKMVADFLYDACFESNFSSLAELYKIPERDGGDIAKTNGANINPLP